MLQNWPFTLLRVDLNDFIFQQNGAPPHWQHKVRAYLNENVPQR